MQLNLNKGFGKFDDYELFQFPDKSIKFKLNIDGKEVSEMTSINVKISLKSNDDIIILALVKDVLNRVKNASNCKLLLHINYMMYQQDDRQFAINESFGLKVISSMINNMNWDYISVFHPHSDKIEFINNLAIFSNKPFVQWSLCKLFPEGIENAVWVIPDTGAFKSQMKTIEELSIKNYVVANKYRNTETGEITTHLSSTNLEGKDCFIVDDICLGGTTFINLAKILKESKPKSLNLIVSHGVFNNGIKHLLEYFDNIYTTNSICNLPQNSKLKIYNL